MTSSSPRARADGFVAATSVGDLLNVNVCTVGVVWCGVVCYETGNEDTVEDCPRIAVSVCTGYDVIGLVQYAL